MKLDRSRGVELSVENYSLSLDRC